MSWRRLRDQVGEWRAMAFSALLSLSAFYLLIIYGASLSTGILLGVMLLCPAIYLVAWLLGGDSLGGGLAPDVRPENAVQRQVNPLRQQATAPLAKGSA